MRNLLIAIVVIALLALGYWWWTGGAFGGLPQQALDQRADAGIKVNGEVQGVWEESGKDGSAE